MTIQKFFPFSSENNTWESFNGGIIQYYAEEPVPYHEEVDWKITAFSLCGLPTFAVYPIPDPSSYDNWQQWTDDFTEIINGPTS